MDDKVIYRALITPEGNEVPFIKGCHSMAMDSNGAEYSVKYNEGEPICKGPNFEISTLTVDDPFPIIREKLWVVSLTEDRTNPKILSVLKDISDQNLLDCLYIPDFCDKDDNIQAMLIKEWDWRNGEKDKLKKEYTPNNTYQIDAQKVLYILSEIEQI